MTNNRIAFLISILSVCIAFWVNEVNLRYLKYEGISLREGQTVQTRDDESYLVPMQTFVETGKLYSNELEKYTSVVRSPGYGAIYAAFLALFGAVNALLYLKIFQVLLFGCSVFCLFFIALRVLKKTSLAATAAVIYGWLPFSMGFLYYTLTEAVTPAIVIFYVFFLIKADQPVQVRTKHLYFFLAAVMFSVLFICRPFLGILWLGLPVFLINSFYLPKKPLKWLLTLLFYGSVSLSLMLGWQIRNYQLLGKVTGLHPVYQNEIPGTFRKSHQAIGAFFMSFGSEGSAFHQTLLPLWESAISGDTAACHADTAVSKIPGKVIGYFGKDRLRDAFMAYQIATLDLKPFYEKNLPMAPVPTEKEQYVICLFMEMTAEYKAEFWFDYYISDPLIVFKNQIFHSNLSLYMFQHPLRGNSFTEILRLLCFALHVLAFCLGLLFVFFNRKVKYITVFWLPLFLSLFYLVYIQRGIEERYTLPLLSLAIIAALYVAASIWNRLFHPAKGLIQ